MTQGNIPPASQEAEDAILGAIIESPTILDDVSAYLANDIFYYERSRRLYLIILDMHKNGEEIDLITITGKLSQSDKDKGVNAYYISGLANNMVAPTMAKRYAIQVYEKHLLREVISQTSEISESAYKNHQDVYNVLDDAHFTIGQLINIRPGLTFNMKDALSDTIENIISSDKNIIKTGFEGIDELSGGMTRGEITVLGGRQGHGKTTTMLNMVKS